jgi:hypothetical protein
MTRQQQPNVNTCLERVTMISCLPQAVTTITMCGRVVAEDHQAQLKHICFQRWSLTDSWQTTLLQTFGTRMARALNSWHTTSHFDFYFSVDGGRPTLYVPPFTSHCLLYIQFPAFESPPKLMERRVIGDCFIFRWCLRQICTNEYYCIEIVC